MEKLARRDNRAAAAEFARARRELAEKTRVARTLEAERDGTGRPNPPPGAARSAAHLSAQLCRREKLCADVARAHAARRAQAATVEAKRARQTETRREQRKYELLRKRQWGHWLRKSLRREQIEIDAIAGLMAASARRAARNEIAGAQGKARRNRRRAGLTAAR